MMSTSSRFHPPLHQSFPHPHSSLSPLDCHASDLHFIDSSAFPSAIDQLHIQRQLEALLAQTSGECMTQPDFIPPCAPNFAFHTPTSASSSSSPSSSATIGGSVDAFATGPFATDLYGAYQMSMGEPVLLSRTPNRARSHQRTPSSSTVGSNGPASPFSLNTIYPHIASSDISPHSPLQFADQADALAHGAPYTSAQSSGLSTHPSLTMKGFAIDGHHDDIPDFIHSSRLSMSSHGNSSPATPLNGGTNYTEATFDGKTANGYPTTGEARIFDSDNDDDEEDIAMMDNCLLFDNTDYRQNLPNVQLFRTESQAYQDELYNPASYTSTPVLLPTRKPEYLSPHRNLVTERLQTANLARSASPVSAMPRERSPFREGSQLAPPVDWQTSGAQMGTAAGMRQRQKQEAEQAEYAQQMSRGMPQLPREQTKTISPKDAVLDYSEPEQAPLFQESIPAGYKQHTTAPGAWQGNFGPQPGSTFGNLSAAHAPQPMAAFRATATDGYTTPDFNFMPLPPDGRSQAQTSAAPLQPPTYGVPKMQFPDSTPEFPPTLVTMESSLSETGPPPSSQESANITTAAPQRPADTRANTGSYTCTYHGCAQRFDSLPNLQKHRREVHKTLPQQAHQQHLMPQVQRQESASTGTSSVSPRSTESPAPSNSGMTSAAIAARNSQAGPHKCARINPSTNKPCNVVFSRPYDLTRHEETIHNNRKHKVRCPMCREEKTFSRNDALTRHMRVVHPEVETFGKRGRRE